MKQSENPSWRRWYAANRERIISRNTARQKANPEKQREYQKRYRERHAERLRPILAARSRAKYQSDPRRGAEQARLSRRKLRLEFINEYGGKCNCCGEREEVFLTLEHKNRDGKQHRKEKGNNPASLLYDLRRRGWPKDNYELLCFNCNRAKWALGVCPHADCA